MWGGVFSESVTSEKSHKWAIFLRFGGVKQQCRFFAKNAPFYSVIEIFAMYLQIILDIDDSIWRDSHNNKHICHYIYKIENQTNIWVVLIYEIFWQYHGLRYIRYLHLERESKRNVKIIYAIRKPDHKYKWCNADNNGDDNYAENFQIESCGTFISYRR